MAGSHSPEVRARNEGGALTQRAGSTGSMGHSSQGAGGGGEGERKRPVVTWQVLQGNLRFVSPLYSFLAGHGGP